MQDLVGINHVLVPEGSWRVAGCQKYMASEADHFSVCKPTSKTSNNYINFLRNIEDLPIARPVPEAVVRLIVFKEDTFKKSVPSVDLYSLEDLKEQLENAPVEFKTRLVDSSEILTELVRLLSKEGWDEGWDADGRIRATTAYILYYLARVEKLRAQIGLYPKALRRLLHLLHMNVGELRKAALYALHVLARDGPSAAAICRREGALDHLVSLMKEEEEDTDLRVKAATTLAFATDKRRENQNSFLDLERAYKILVRILEEKQSPNLLYSAAHALANVPEYHSELAKQPESLITLAMLVVVNIRGESREQNEERMVHCINVATIFREIIAGGANARVHKVTEDNVYRIELGIENFGNLRTGVLKGLERWINLSILRSIKYDFGVQCYICKEYIKINGISKEYIVIISLFDSIERKLINIESNLFDGTLTESNLLYETFAEISLYIKISG